MRVRAQETVSGAVCSQCLAVQGCLPSKAQLCTPPPSLSSGRRSHTAHAELIAQASAGHLSARQRSAWCPSTAFPSRQADTEVGRPQLQQAREHCRRFAHQPPDSHLRAGDRPCLQECAGLPSENQQALCVQRQAPVCVYVHLVLPADTCCLQEPATGLSMPSRQAIMSTQGE